MQTPSIQLLFDTLLVSWNIKNNELAELEEGRNAKYRARYRVLQHNETVNTFMEYKEKIRKEKNAVEYARLREKMTQIIGELTLWEFEMKLEIEEIETCKMVKSAARFTE